MSEEVRTALVSAALDLWRQTGQPHYIPVQGESMLPFLRAGDEVLVAHRYHDIRRGDIVVFRIGDKLIIHRVLQIDGHTGRITTGGDNTTRFDDPVTHADIIGRVIGLRRGRKTVLLDTRTWRRLGLFIATGSLLTKHLAARSRSHHELPAWLSQLGRRCTVVPFTRVGALLMNMFYRWDD